jgi:hypothetical protein
MKVRNPSSDSIGVQNWREVYKAALFETDRQKLPSRIAEAERALILRRENYLQYRAIRSKKDKLLMTRFTRCGHYGIA